VLELLKIGIESPNERWIKTDPGSSAQMKLTFRRLRLGGK